MTNKHLTDVEIQAYITDLKALKISTHSAHIHNCPACKTKTENYIQIIAGIEQQPLAVFDFNVAELVMTQLPSTNPKSKPMPLITYIDLIAGLFLLVFFILYFRKSLVDIFSGSMILNILLLTTCAVILIFQIIDIQKKYKKNMHILDKY